MLRSHLLACALFACCVTSAALTDVFTAHSEGYACFRIPAVVAHPLSPRTLVAFAEGRFWGCADHGWVDLVSKRSLDGGATWSALALVRSESSHTANVTIGNPCPIVSMDAAGTVTLLLPFSRNNLAVGLLRSTDFGLSWSEAIPITLPASWTWVATGPPGGMQLAAGGRLVLPIDWQAPQQPYSSQLLLSDDLGASWRLATSGVAGGNECQAVPLPWLSPQHVLLSMRQASGTHRLGALSTDGGETFAVPFPTLAEGDCEGSTIGISSASLVLMSSAFDAKKRANLTLHGSADAGRTWAPLQTIYAGSAAYSSLVDTSSAAGQASIGVLFERESYGFISYAALAVPKGGGATVRGA